MKTEYNGMDSDCGNRYLIWEMALAFLPCILGFIGFLLGLPITALLKAGVGEAG